MQGVREAEVIARQAEEAVRRKRRDAAATRSERGDARLTRFDYLEAALHFRAAADMLPPSEIQARIGYLNRYARALYRHGDEKGDNAVFAQAIHGFREALRQNNLGNVLKRRWRRIARH